MKVPFADLTRDEKETFIEGTSLEQRIKWAIFNVIDKKAFILGEHVASFENSFAEFCGVKYCIGVSDGLSALELSLISKGIGSGDEVITVANTFNATVGGILKTGAKPVLVDASNSDFNIDINKISEKISKNTKAIIPVHLYGQSSNMNPLWELAERNNLSIIEDACQAHGATFEGKRVGSLGKAGCFSFYPGKNLGSYGDGGAVVTNDSDVADFIRKTRNYGQSKKYFHDIRPDNARLDAIQAVVLSEKLKVLDKWNAMRSDNARIYRDNLNEVNDIELPSERKSGEHVYHLYVIKSDKRDELEKYLESRGITTGLHYPVPIHLQKCFAHIGYKEGDFPVSEHLSKKVLTLPMFPTMRKEEITYITDSIKEFLTTSQES